MSREDRDTEKNRRIAALESMLIRARAESWDEGWRAAREVVDFEGTKVWAHTVYPEGYEGNPYREGAS